MLTEQEIEDFLKQMTPLEKMMKQVYEAGEYIFDQKPEEREKYTKTFLKDCENYPWEHPLNRICGRGMTEKYSLTHKGERSLIRHHMTHEDYALKNGTNLKIIRHGRYAVANMHDHEFIEMSYVLSGNCSHQIEDFCENKDSKKQLQEICMKAGDLMILPPGMRHRIEVFNESVIINILMNTNTFEKAFLSQMPENNPLYDFFHSVIFSEKQNSFILFETENQTEIRKYIFQLIGEYVQENEYSSKICQHLVEILFLKLMAHPGKMVFSEKLPSDMEKVAPMILYLQEHFDQVTLEDVARQFHYSKTSINRIFKKYTHTTITHFIRQRRMEKARELLETTDMAVREIAQAVGYEDTSYFIEQFKAKYGVTPHQIRKKR